MKEVKLRHRPTESQSSTMAPNMDNDGPSDEEGSGTSNSLLQSPLKPKKSLSSFEESPLPPRARKQNKKPNKRGANTISGRHEGKIIEISSIRTRAEQRYESFPMGRHPPSREGSVSDEPANEARGRVSPTKKQIGRARQVLVHYHPQMGDEGYESTLLSDDHKMRGRSSPPAFRDHKTVGGMHSRCIDDVREKETWGNDEEDNAATRQLRRRVLRMTLERTVSVDEKLRKMRRAEEDVDGPTKFGRNRKVAVEESASKQLLAVKTSDVPPRTLNSTPRSIDSDCSRPPPPPSTTPSYRLIVAQLIKNNEPERLSQIDRVMEKYRGREEELIAKLDLRYRKKKREKVNGLAERVVGRSVMKNLQDSPRSVGSGLESRVEKRHVEVPKQPKLEKVQTEPSSPQQEKKQSSFVSSPSKNRTAVLTMQSWDKKHGQDDDDQAVEKEDVTTPKETGQDEEEIMPPTPNPLDHRNSSKTQVHSNLEKDVEDSEGRLPKVPERDTIEPRSTPTRAVDAEKTAGTPFSDDISLITMETKGTSYLNRAEGGEGVYSFAEMTRRPPASIIVDGGSPQPVDSPMAEKDAEVSAKPTEQNHQQMAPPKINRLLPEYEKVSESEKTKAAEESQQASAKLDSVEARILARRQLREEEAKTTEMQQQPSEKTEMKTLEEHATMALDEEESFLGKTIKDTKQPQSEMIHVESSSSLLGDEANQRSSIDGSEVKNVKSYAEVVKSASGDEFSMLSQGVSPRELVDNNHHADEVEPPVPVPSFDEEVPLDEAKSLPRQSTPQLKEDEMPLLDESHEIDATPKVNRAQAEDVDEEDWSHLPTVKTVKGASNIDLYNRQNGELDESASITQVASRDAEIKLKEMEDEIARLVAEKESRFAAEKAAALKKAERALEEERKARLEAEEARLNAEKELERLKAEAEERLKLVEAEKERARLRVEAEAEERLKLLDDEIERERQKVDLEARRKRKEAERTLERLRAEAEEEAKASVEVEQRTLAIPSDAGVITQASIDEQSAPLEQSMSVDSMDHETKAELMSMIAAMEEQALPTVDTEPEPGANNAVDDSIAVDKNTGNNDSVDIVEMMRSVWASDDEESQHEEHASTSDDESDYEIKDSSYESQQNDVPRSALMVDVDDSENDSQHSGEQSYLPESLSPDRISTTISSSDLHDFPPTTMPQGPLNHDFSSFTMPYQPVGTAQQSLDASEPQPTQTKETLRVKDDLPRKPSLLDDEEGEANIHHVARVTFDGDTSKGQLSFTTGSEVLAHSNQRGDWWLGRCGGRTGWFPASAIVPASEFLRNQLGSGTNDAASSAEVDDAELQQLSQEELHQVYDLIRSPSGEDESPKRVRKDVSPPPSRLDPSESAGLKERLYESNEDDQTDAKNAFDSMMNEYDSMLAPVSVSNKTEEHQIKKEPQLESKHSELNTTTNMEEKRPKRVWREAHDPNTGLTYYYNVKTRETTWDKPADFVERNSPAKHPTTPTETNNVEPDVPSNEPTAKDNQKPGGKRFLGLFSKGLGKKNHDMSPKSASSSPKTSPTTVTSGQIETSKATQSDTKEANYESKDTQNQLNDQTVSFLNDDVGDDESSVSSEATSNSIFSTKRMKEALGKVTSKISGKKTIKLGSASYDMLDDSVEKDQRSALKKTQNDNLPANIDGKVKQPVEPRANSTIAMRQTEGVQEQKPTVEAKPSSPGKKKDSRWRSAIDPLTGRTYYFHKDTKETVWEKPKNL